MTPAAVSAAARLGAPITCTAPSSNIWTFTMRNSPAPKRQITQETSQTQRHRRVDAWARSTAPDPRRVQSIQKHTGALLRGHGGTLRAPAHVHAHQAVAAHDHEAGLEHFHV